MPRRTIPPACRRPVTWGQHLLLTAVNRHGLKAAVDAISDTTGGVLGTRNTFAKLFDLETPPDVATKEYDRAYALLLALGEDPADWGIDDDFVPALLKRSRDLLLLRSGCLSGIAA